MSKRNLSAILILMAITVWAAAPAYTANSGGNSVTLPVYHDTTMRSVADLTSAELTFLATVPVEANGHLRVAVQQMLLASVCHVPVSGKYQASDSVHYWTLYQAWTGPAKVTVPLIPGATGATGDTGATGQTGATGTPGTPGAHGQDGRSIVQSYVSADGYLIVVYSDGEVCNTGYVVGPSGPQGLQGFPGRDGCQGPPGPIVFVYSGAQQSGASICAAPTPNTITIMGGMAPLGGGIVLPSRTTIIATGGSTGPVTVTTHTAVATTTVVPVATTIAIDGTATGSATGDGKTKSKN